MCTISKYIMRRRINSVEFANYLSIIKLRVYRNIIANKIIKTNIYSSFN